MGYIFLSHWPTVSLRSQALQVIVNVIGHPPQPDGKTLALNTLLPQVTGHGEIQLVLPWKLHLYWLVFTELVGAVHILRKK